MVAVLMFVDNIEFIRQSGFSLDELGYLLRHKIRVGAPFSLIEQEHARLLAELRSTFQRGDVLGEISGDNLRRQLQRLGWYPELIESAVGPDGLAYYPQVAIQIQRLNPAPQIPAEIRDKFYYKELSTSPSNAELGSNGVVTDRQFHPTRKCCCQ